MSCLAPCPACQRHVSTHDTACPFCAAALPESFRCPPARGLPPSRLGRAARLAAGAALLSASCGSAVAAYGIAIIPDAGAADSSSSADTSASDGNDDDAAPAPLAAPKKI
ncbi:MAG TPA: hypothetical protein VIF57_21300 [Polyangia bacterium]|jgi:hypothetical protein